MSFQCLASIIHVCLAWYVLVAHYVKDSLEVFFIMGLHVIQIVTEMVLIGKSHPPGNGYSESNKQRACVNYNITMKVIVSRITTYSHLVIMTTLNSI